MWTLYAGVIQTFGIIYGKYDENVTVRIVSKRGNVHYVTL